MAAGLGFKTFNTGDVLSAADVNGYLMQNVWVFANSAARTSAVTSPQEGNVSFLKDTNSLEIYDGAAWVAYGAGDITGVTAGTGISGGGTSGAVTITNSMATAIDAKGDLIVGTGADTFDRLAVGATNNHVLTVDSSTATGLKWAAVASSSPNSDSAEVTTSQTTTSTTYTDLTTAGPAVTVTTGTKALVIITTQIQPTAIDQSAFMSYAVSGTTTIAANDKFAVVFRGSGTNGQNIFRASSAFMIENLTAGSNTFTAKYRVAAGTGDFTNRQITVIDMGS